ncbi:sodium:proton antiporter, partial [Mesorhizobium sp. M00.F.Ca.ET.149.01.1.1]
MRQRGGFTTFAKVLAAGIAAPLILAFPQSAFAAEIHELPGAAMSLWWALPFAGLLLSIATGPLLFPHLWEHHYGKIAAGWAALVVVPLAIAFGIPTAGETVLHTLLTEYLSFIILLFA